MNVFKPRHARTLLYFLFMTPYSVDPYSAPWLGLFHNTLTLVETVRFVTRCIYIVMWGLYLQPRHTPYMSACIRPPDILRTCQHASALQIYSVHVSMHPHSRYTPYMSACIRTPDILRTCQHASALQIYSVHVSMHPPSRNRYVASEDGAWLPMWPIN